MPFNDLERNIQQLLAQKNQILNWWDGNLRFLFCSNNTDTRFSRFLSAKFLVHSERERIYLRCDYLDFLFVRVRYSSFPISFLRLLIAF
jgi:hypothetical protein